MHLVPIRSCQVIGNFYLYFRNNNSHQKLVKDPTYLILLHHSVLLVNKINYEYVLTI